MIKISLPLLLTIMFFILKITEVINWGWIWVFSPLWIPWVVVGLFASGILTLIGIGFVINDITEYFNEKKRRK